MKKIFIFLLFFLFSISVYSKPLFTKIELAGDEFQGGYTKLMLNNQKVYLKSSGAFYILDSNFNLIKKITPNSLYDLVKNDMSLPEKMKDTVMFINNFNIDDEGKLWLGTYHGVFVYSDTTLTKIYHNKNSEMLVNDIRNIQFNQDTVILNPIFYSQFYYLSNDKIRLDTIPWDSTNETTKYVNYENAVVNNNKLYYIGNYKNLIEKEGMKYEIYSLKNYSPRARPYFKPIPKVNRDTVYFFEEGFNFQIVKYCNGNFSNYDFNKNNIVPIEDSCNILFKGFEFDNDNIIWALFQLQDIRINKSFRYLMRYKDEKDIQIYLISELLGNDTDMVFNDIYFDKASNQLYGFDGGSIYKADIATGIADDLSGLPNLYLHYIYPNPVKNKFKLEFVTLPNKVSKLEIKLYNYFGVEMNKLKPEISYNSSNGLGTIEADIKTIPNGLYIVTLSNGDFTRSCKMIVQQ